MRAPAALMAILMLSSILAGCAGSDSGTEKDERITSLESELANVTAQANDSISQAVVLEATLSEALASLEEKDAALTDLSAKLTAAEWHKANLTNQLSEVMGQLNQSEDAELMVQLEEQIENLSTQIGEADSQITSLSSNLAQKQNEIGQLNATIAALQSTMNSLTYSVRNRIDSCPLDNPGLEVVGGYDDGAGAASSGDGQINYDEIEFRVGECPGYEGVVSDFQNNSDGFGPSLIVKMGGDLYFAADDGIHGWELWRSDGTVGGTYLVKDLRGEECGSDGQGGEICTNGGSLVVHCWSAPFGCHYPEMVAGNDKIFFTGFNGEPGTESTANVIVSDGTEAGTHMVRMQWNNWGTAYGGENGWLSGYTGARNLVAIPSSGSIPDRVVYSVLEVIGGETAQSHPPTGEELWITDGTDSGTTMIANLVPEDESWQYQGTTYCCADFQGSSPKSIVKKGNQIWFTGVTDDYGRELYRYVLGGVSGGLYLVKDINPGAEGSNPDYVTSAKGGIYLSANDGLTGQELYFSQGDAFTTNLVKDINPGNNSSSPMQLTQFGDYLVFTADDGQNGRELWISDKTESGTFMVKDINSNGSGDPYQLHVLDGVLYFTAHTDEHGRELWKSDGTTVGTTMVKDINPGNNSSYYWIEGFTSGNLFIIHQGELYFGCDDGVHGVEICRSDGTYEGTKLAVDVTPGENSSWPLWLTSMGEKLYFTAYSEDRGRHLWFHWDNPGPVISPNGGYIPGNDYGDNVGIDEI